MFRMMTLVFEGEPRFGKDRHPHEAPATMLVPLIILAFLSVTGGLLGIPHALGGGNILETWLTPVFERSERILGSSAHGSLAMEYLLMALSVAAGLAGILLARRLYLTRRDVVDTIAARFASLHTLLFRKYFVDEAYDAVVLRPLQTGSRQLLWKGIDAGLIDGTVNGCARLVNAIASVARRMQTGNVSHYGFAVLVGISLLLGFIIARWNG